MLLKIGYDIFSKYASKLVKTIIKNLYEVGNSSIQLT